MDIQRLSVSFLGKAFCANCMTGGTKAEQFARCRPGQWQPMLGAENVQVTERQQLGAVSRKAALHLLSLLANKQPQSKHKYEHIH